MTQKKKLRKRRTHKDRNRNMRLLLTAIERIACYECAFRGDSGFCPCGFPVAVYEDTARSIKLGPRPRITIGLQ